MAQAQISVIERATFGMLARMMTEGQRIKHLRKELLGMTQEEFAELLGGVTRGAVGNWEHNKGIKRENLIRVAEKTGAPFEWLAMGSGPAPQSAALARARRAEDDDGAEKEDAPSGRLSFVRVVGYAGAGAKAHFYSVDEQDLDEVPAPSGATERTRAIEIRGDSLGTAFNRWLAFYDDVKRPVTDDLIGRLCIVRLADGNTLIKTVRATKTPGRYRLTSDEPPIENVEIEWAARVKMISPK